MTIGQKYLHINNFTWHCFSIFYAKENFFVLLKAIKNFCQNNKDYMNHWSMYFDNLQGTRINLVFISKKEKSEILVPCIEQYFDCFLKENPSENLYPIAYSSIIWTNYPNNSFIWNAFQIPYFLLASRKIRDFSQATSLLIADLYDSECSYDENAISIAGFLSVQLLKRQNIVMPTIINPEIAEIIQSYWNWEDEEILTSWRKHANIKIGISIINSHLNLPENFFDILLTK